MADFALQAGLQEATGRTGSRRVGREAARCAKGLFAIVLVAASFAGGAVGQRPRAALGAGHDPEPAGDRDRDHDPGRTGPGPASEPSAGGGVAPVEEIPSRPIPPLVIPPAASEPAPLRLRPRRLCKADPASPWPPAMPATPPASERAEPPWATPPARASRSPRAPSTLEPPAHLSTSKDRERRRRLRRARSLPAAPVDPEVDLAALPPDSGPPVSTTPPAPRACASVLSRTTGRDRGRRCVRWAWPATGSRASPTGGSGSTVSSPWPAAVRSVSSSRPKATMRSRRRRPRCGGSPSGGPPSIRPRPHRPPRNRPGPCCVP